MKYKDEYKIEFELRKGAFDDQRYVFFRIVPSELPLLQRWFGNPWIQLYRDYKYVTAFKYTYDAKEYQEEVVPLKTYGDARRYINDARMRVRKKKLKEVERGERWPDEV